MQVDIYTSGARTEWRLIVRAGDPVAPLVDYLVTGLCTMLPLTLFVSNVDLGIAVPGPRGTEIAYAMDNWRGAVARIGEFNDSIFPPGSPATGESRDDPTC